MRHLKLEPDAYSVTDLNWFVYTNEHRFAAVYSKPGGITAPDVVTAIFYDIIAR